MYQLLHTQPQIYSTKLLNIEAQSFFIGDLDTLKLVIIISIFQNIMMYVLKTFVEGH